MPTPFTTFNLDPALLRAITELGFEEATPVQEQVIPLMLEGKDVIAQAQTGTGKTAAFGLPILQRLDPSARYPQALVLAPTRELAVQVAEALHRMGKYKAVSSLAIYGGQPIERQLRALRQGVQIVIGTPGRIMDHIRRGTLDLDRVATVILDEADEMLDMGFIEDVEFILDQVPAERQSGLFSATIPPRIVALARRYMRAPARVTIEKEKMTVPQVRQVYYDVAGRDKLDALTRILDFETPASTIIFCARKSEADALGESLQGRGYAAEVLHGDLNQTQRDRVMHRFRSGQVEILVATDVAARRREAVIEQIRAAIDEGALEPYLSMVEALGDDYDPVEIAAAALKVLGDGTLMRAEPAAASGDGAGVEPGMERLFIHAGRRAGLRPMDIVGAIANEAGLPGNRIGAIDLYDNFAFVEVPKEDARRVLAALTHTTLRGQRVDVDVARPKRESARS